MRSEAGATEHAPSRLTAPRPLVLDWERAKVGDRLAGFTMFLPASPRGPVLLAVAPMVGHGLQWRFPDAVLLQRADTVDDADHNGLVTVRWDGRHLPVRPGSVGLLIVDTRYADPALLRPALADEATLAVLGPEGRLAVYPDAKRPEHIWQPGWPVPAMRTLRAQMRRSAGLRTRLRHDVTKLQVDGPEAPTVLDELLADLRARTGEAGTVVGIYTAGDTIVRVRQRRRELAVRLSLTDLERDFGSADRVIQDVPDVRRFVQRPVASGTTSGGRWVATEWLPRRRRSPVELRRVADRQWAVAEDLVRTLQAVPTDGVDGDWARRWCEAVAPIVEKETREQLQAILEDVPLDTPTGWAHGDLWPGNVLVDHDVIAVIDWENSARDAPLGLEWLLVAALRARVDEQVSVASACAAMIDDPQAVDAVIGGRLWSEWERAGRAALATAAYVLHLRNRALFDVGTSALDRDLAVMIEAAHGTPAPPPSTVVGGDSPAPTGAGRAARGALWLGTSALVVKGLQTVVLLVLAALLAPSALGLIAIGTLVMNISTALSDLGTSSALVYFRGDVRRAARSAVTVAGLVGVALTVLAWAVAPVLTRALHVQAEGIDVIRGLTSVLAVQSVTTVHYEMMRRQLQFARRIVPDVISGVVGAVLAIVLASLGHGVSSLVIGQIVQTVLALLIAWIVTAPILPGWRAADVRVLVGYGGHLSGGNLAQLALLNVDYLIVSRVLGGTALGEYSLAFRLAYLPYLNIAVVIGGAAFPYLCRLDRSRLGAAAERISGVVVTVVLPLCAGIALLADQLELLGHQWAPAVPVVRWLMVYAIVLSTTQILQVALNSGGKPRTTFGLRVLHVLALTVALLILAPHGITAVGIGQVLAVVLVTIVSLALVRRELPGFRLVRLIGALGPAFLGVVVMSAAVLGLDAWLPGDRISVVRLVLLGLVGAVAYAVPVWWLDRDRLVQTVALLRAGR